MILSSAEMFVLLSQTGSPSATRILLYHLLQDPTTSASSVTIIQNSTDYWRRNQIPAHVLRRCQLCCKYTVGKSLDWFLPPIPRLMAVFLLSRKKLTIT